MKSMKNTPLVIIGLLALAAVVSCKNRSESSLLSDKNGDGGTVIVCDKKLQELGGLDIMVTDLYVFRKDPKLKKLKIPVDKHGQYAHYLEIVKIILKRFKYLDYSGYKKMQALINQVDPEQKIDAKLAKLHLPKVGDEGAIELPEEGNCEIKYAVIQKNSSIPGWKTFQFQKEIWTRLDNINKAALLVHEILIRQYNNTIDHLRYAVAHAFADKLPSAKNLKYLWFAKKFLTPPSQLVFLPEQVLPNSRNDQLVQGLTDGERLITAYYKEPLKDGWPNLTLTNEEVTAPTSSGETYTMGCPHKSKIDCYTYLHIPKFTKDGKIDQVNINQNFFSKEGLSGVKPYIPKGLVEKGLIKASCREDERSNCTVEARLKWSPKQKAYIYASPF